VFPDRDRTNNTLANLSWGTVKENKADMKVHATRLCGEKLVGCPKLNAVEVKAIRRLRSIKGMTHKEIAGYFGIRKTHARELCKGQSWKHLEPEDPPNEKVA
jgi:hypothetical protein